MLKDIEVNKSMSKEDYEQEMSNLALKLGELQREAKNIGMPTIVVFEGWDAAGKGTFMNEILQALDPRGFNVYPTLSPTEDEKLHPFLWRFWIKTPAKGRITFFDRSWYRRVTTERLEKNLDKHQLEIAFKDILCFERQLTDSGCAIVKFFLHISKNEQKKRFQKLEKDVSTAWRVTSEDWNNHKNYNDYLSTYETMIHESNTKTAPWVIVEAHDKRYATVKVFKALIKAMENGIKNISSQTAVTTEDGKINSITNDDNKFLTLNDSILDKINLNVSLPEVTEYKSRLKYCKKRLRELEHEIYRRRIPVVIVYEGWHAAGKGGNIKRLISNLDPRGYEVVPIAAPNDEEKAHHYLWRFWKKIPKDGHMTIFDRSWYGRVLVERIEKLCSEQEWKRAFTEINEMEYDFVKHGTIVVKFWLHIDNEEQLKRFTQREETPDKNWKITEEDWRNREKWDSYKAAIDEMLLRTSTSYAPWTVIESNDKRFARIKALETVIKMIEEKLY